MSTKKKKKKGRVAAILSHRGLVGNSGLQDMGTGFKTQARCLQQKEIIKNISFYGFLTVDF